MFGGCDSAAPEPNERKTKIFAVVHFFRQLSKTVGFRSQL